MRQRPLTAEARRKPVCDRGTRCAVRLLLLALLPLSQVCAVVHTVALSV